uniref:C-type lectin domain family 2 member A-like isoform X2 n=1 Tax=Camelus bactrianus TaxID=9837 RepID=A0A9W3FT06_CAMBA|nr:C-type lectin domain family 2 member A-like isoform X2 [Camelus bactrianus]
MVCGLARRSHCRSPRREGDMDNQRRLMNAGDSQSSGDVISSNLTIESHEPPKGNKKKPCVSKIIAIIIFLVILIITLAIVLAVEKHKSSMEHVSCLDGWIGYLGKCFYFSENTTTWAASQNFCAAHAANPAVFNTTEELNFLKRYSDHSQYWIGLRQKPGQTWQWIDGTIYSGWLKIIGIGECAYLHQIGISSASTHLVRKWICSRPDTCIPRS